MESLLALILTILAIFGWVVGAFRPRSQYWIRIGMVPGVVVLAFYFVVQLIRTTPELYNGTAEVGWPTLIAMIMGLWALLAHPRHDRRKPNGAAHA